MTSMWWSTDWKLPKRSLSYVWRCSVAATPPYHSMTEYVTLFVLRAERNINFGAAARPDRIHRGGYTLKMQSNA
jgi:hypothetical protein